LYNDALAKIMSTWWKKGYFFYASTVTQ